MGEGGVNPANVELVGLWSSGAGYYDTFSDEWLIFRPDGTGRLVFLSPFEDHSRHFRWRIVAPGVIDLTGFARPEVGDDGRAAVGGDAFHFSGVRYSVAEAERPPDTGQRMRELRLDLGVSWPTDLGFVTGEYESAEARLRGD